MDNTVQQTSLYVCRSRICIKSSTSDGSLFQPILLSFLDCVGDCYASCKGEMTMWFTTYSFVVSYI